MKKKTRSRQQSAFANPVLLGAVTVLVVLVAVFLAYNANSGLPFVPTRELKVDVPDGSNLVVGNDVLEGGTRVGFVSAMRPLELSSGKVGAQLTLKLSPQEGKVPVNSHVTIRLRSVFGEKYVDLVKGTSKKVYPDGGTMPIKHSSVPVQLDQVYNIFTPPTRKGIQNNLVGFGDTFASRGADLNVTIQNLPRLMKYLRPVAAYLAAPSTQLTHFIGSLDTFARVLAPLSNTTVKLLADASTTFQAITSNPADYKATIAQSPSTLTTSTHALRVSNPFLTDFTVLGHDLTPATASLKRALPQLNPAIETGTVTLRKTPVLNAKLQQVMGALKALSLDPGTNIALNALTATVNTLNPVVRYLGPFQTVCDDWNYMWSDLADVVAEPTQFGTAQRALLMSNNPSQKNSPSMEPATQPANGGAVNSPPLSSLGGNAFAHGEAYGSAVSSKGLADCETGQRGYVTRLNHLDPQHRNFDTDAHTPGSQGPTFAGRARVPAGETFSREPTTGPKLPYIPQNP
ncbi:MAG TPA: MlaD family protein [Solirubrobacteraceae bacterium]|nr:MlaD family protein [Solirubrobacteraceae bacterium]